MADGSLKFDTKINTEGFEDGASTIQRAARACAESVQKVGKSANEAFQKSSRISGLENQIDQTKVRIRTLAEELERLSASSVPTEEFTELSSLVEKTQLKLDRLLDRQEKMESGGVRHKSSAWKNLQYDIDETTRKLEIYKGELQDTISRDRAFTSGADSAAYAKKSTDLDNLNNKLYVQQQRLQELIVKEAQAGEAAQNLTNIRESAQVSDQKIVELNQHLQELAARQKELKAAGVGPGYAEYDSNASQIADMTAEIKRYQAAAQGGGSSGQSLASGMSVAAIAGNRLLPVLKLLGDAALNKVSNAAGRAAQKVGSLAKVFFFGQQKANGMSRGIAGMTKRIVLLSLLRGVIHGITSAMKEGVQNLAGYSSGFNALMSSFISSLLQLKNSFAASFSPAISAIIPILDALAQRLITVINLIGQFLAAITGKGTFTKAVKVNKDYAAGVKAAGSAAKDAGKDAKKALAPFDELNTIQEQGAGGSGGGGGGAGGIDPSQMFEEVAINGKIKDFADQIRKMFEAEDWEGIGKLVGEKINDAVLHFTDYISWSRVGGKITKFVTAFTTMFNSLIGAIDWNAAGILFGTGINTLTNTLFLLLTQIDWQLLGSAFARGLNGMVHTVDWDLFGRTIGAYFQMKIALLYGFVTTADWSGIGQAFGMGLNGAVSQINWEMLGLAFSTGIGGLFATVGNFATTFDWTGFGSSVALSLSTFFQNFDWAGSSTATSDLVLGFLDALIAFVTETDWQAFGTGVGDVLTNINWLEIASKIFEAFGGALGAIFGALAGLVGDLIVKGVTAARDYFQGKIEECGGNVVAGILKGILDGFIGIHVWILENIYQPFVDAFLKAFGISGGEPALEKYGKDLWDGFCNGVKKFFANPGAFIKANITDPFINKVKELLGIHSPSTVLEGIGGNTVEGFNQGVSKNQTSTQSIVQSWAKGIGEWFASKLGISNKNSKESAEWANSILTGYNDTVGKNYTKSQAIMEKWAESVRTWFEGSGEAKGVNEASWKKYADTVIKAFAAAVQEKYSSTRTNMETWSNSIKESFWGGSNPGGTGGMYQDFYNMGKRINEGFASGISDFAHLAKAAMNKWSSGIIQEAKEGLDIHSPSREAYSIAEYFAKGFNDGLLAMAKSSMSAADQWLDNVMSVFEGAGIQVPVGVSIPNAAAYLPRAMQGAVIPPRAGEVAYSSKWGTDDGSGDFFASMKQMFQEVVGEMKGEDGQIALTVNLDGKVIYEDVVKRNKQTRKQIGRNPLTE